MNLVYLATQPAPVEWTMSPYLIITLLFGGILALYFIYFSLNTNIEPKPAQEEEKKEEPKKKAPKEKKKEQKVIIAMSIVHVWRLY
jgi:hypothetical protein